MIYGSFFGGEATNVFQGRDVYGGVYFQPPARQVLPAQVLEPPRHYRNNDRQLDELSCAHAAAVDGVGVAIIRGAPGSGRTLLCECWAYRNREHFPDGVYPARLGRRPVADVLADLLQLAGHDAEQLPASLDGRAAMWRGWTADRRIAVLIDDALRAADVQALLPAGIGSMALVVEAGSLTELRARHSAKEVRLDPLTDDAAKGVLTEMVGAERLLQEPEQLAELLRICAGSAAELTVAGALLAESPTWPLERLVRRIERKGGLASQVFDVAYDRLPVHAQACWRALGANPGDGDVSEETLVAILGLDFDEVEEALRVLLRAMLVVETTTGRYRMSGHARIHAASKAGDLDLIGHYAWTGLAIAERVLARGWAKLLWSDFAPADCTPEEGRAWLEAERVNLVASTKSAKRMGRHRDVFQLALALWPLHVLGGESDEMELVNRYAITAAQAWPSSLATALARIQWGYSAMQRRQWDNALEQFRQAATDAKSAGLAEARATAVESLALALYEAGQRHEGEAQLRLNLELAMAIGEPRRVALACFHLSKKVSPEEAADLLDRAETVLGGEAHNRVKIALVRGMKTAEAGSLDSATQQLTEVARLAGDEGWHYERIVANRALAEAALARGDRPAARAYAEDALHIAQIRGFTADAAALMTWLAHWPDQLEF